MPWVHRHRRRTPYSWFRTTTVRSHYRRPSNSLAVVIAVIAVLILLVVIF